MRTYSKNYKAFPRTVTRPSARDIATRQATEWDVRLDVNEGFTSAHVLEHAVAHQDKFTYCLIGDVERPDDQAIHPGNTKPSQGSTQDHVHIAIILVKPSTRGEVLQLLRGPRKRGDEYAVPRNLKYTYAGWVMHHTKQAYKINPDGPLVLYENGDLPMDAYTPDKCWAVVRMMKKFGNDVMKERFKSYSNKLDEFKADELKDALAKIPPLGDAASNYILPKQM